MSVGFEQIGADPSLAEQHAQRLAALVNANQLRLASQQSHRSTLLRHAQTPGEAAATIAAKITPKLSWWIGFITYQRAEEAPPRDIGMATVALNQYIEGNHGVSVSGGTFVDYWLAMGYNDPRTHDTAGASLLRKATTQDDDIYWHSRPFAWWDTQAFTVVDPQQADKPDGLLSRLHAINLIPVPLKVPDKYRRTRLPGLIVRTPPERIVHADSYETVAGRLAAEDALKVKNS